MQPIAIYGGGGFAKGVAWLIEQCNKEAPLYNTVCFIDDNTANHGKILNGIPVMGLEETQVRFPDALVVGGVGNPRTRQLVMEKSAAAGFGFATIVHPRVECSRWTEIGIGTVICTGNILATNIVLGQHVQINMGCTLGHDVTMGDYATLTPGVHVSGWVKLGQRVFVGTGAVIINGTEEHPLVIEDDVIIGAGACVTKSVSSGLTVVGVPAKPLLPR